MDDRAAYDPNVPSCKQEAYSAAEQMYTQSNDRQDGESLCVTQGRSTVSPGRKGIQSETRINEDLVPERDEHAVATNTLKIELETIADATFRLSEGVCKLQEEKQQLIRDKARLRDDNRAQANSLARFQIESNQKSSDDYFSKAWQGLKYSILNWSSKHFRDSPKPRKDTKMHRDLAALVGDAQAYMVSDQKRLLLVQSCVWCDLEDAVLHSNAVVWAGKHKRAFKDLLTAMECSSDPETASNGVNPRDFHRWRALTAALLGSVVDAASIQEEAVNVVNRISAKLLPYSASQYNNLDGFSQELLAIVHQAISLRRELDQQRAQFEFCRREGLSRGFWTDAKGLDAVKGSIKEDVEVFVKLVVVPGLYRFGDLDGEGNNQEEVVVAKCVVESIKCRKKREDHIQQAPAKPQYREQKQTRLMVGASDGYRDPRQSPRNLEGEATAEERYGTLAERAMQERSQSHIREDPNATPSERLQAAVIEKVTGPPLDGVQDGVEDSIRDSPIDQPKQPEAFYDTSEIPPEVHFERQPGVLKQTGKTDVTNVAKVDNRLARSKSERSGPELPPFKPADKRTGGLTKVKRFFAANGERDEFDRKQGWNWPRG